MVWHKKRRRLDGGGGVWRHAQERKGFGDGRRGVEQQVVAAGHGQRTRGTQLEQERGDEVCVAKLDAHLLEELARRQRRVDVPETRNTFHATRIMQHATPSLRCEE